MNASDCNEDKKNLGLSRCTKMPALPTGMISTPIGFKLTPTQLLTPAATKAALQAALLAGIADRIYLWPQFVGFENLTEAAVYEVNAVAYEFVRNGNYVMRFTIKEGLCFHKAMFTHRSRNGRAFILDIEEQMTGTEDTDGNFMGMTYKLINPENLQWSDGTVSTKSPVLIAFANSKELNERGAILDAPFIGELIRLSDVTLEVVSAEDDELVVKVFVTCDGTPVNGLSDADFVMLDEAGAAQSITLGSEDDGTYTFSGSGLESGTINLVSAATLSVPGYEAAATTVTVTS